MSVEGSGGKVPKPTPELWGADAGSPALALRSIILSLPWSFSSAHSVFDCEPRAFSRTTRLARATCYLLGIDILLFALQKFFKLLKVSWGQALSGWVGILSFLVIVLLIVLAIRWLKARTLWRFVTG